MPTMRQSDVEATAGLILAALPRLEAAHQPPYPAWKFPPAPGAVPYGALIEDLRAVLPAGRAHHLTRATLDSLAARNAVQLWLRSRSRKSTGTRVDRVEWVRTPGKRERWTAPLDRPRDRPDKPRRGMRPTTAMCHPIAAATTAPLEAAVLRLLAEPIDERDLMACSNGSLPPEGSGWVPLHFIVTRIACRQSLPPWGKWKLTSLALRRLAERGLVQLWGGSRESTGLYSPRPQPPRPGRRLWRARWARLSPTPSPVAAPTIDAPYSPCLPPRRGPWSAFAWCGGLRPCQT